MIRFIACCVGIVALWASSNTICLADETTELKARVTALEKRCAELESGLRASRRRPVPEERAAANRASAHKRMQRDAEVYTPQQLQEIESLYQVANRKWQSEAARTSLRTLVEKYPKANRTGCAVLYLGQMTRNNKQIAPRFCSTPALTIWSKTSCSLVFAELEDHAAISQAISPADFPRRQVKHGRHSDQPPGRCYGNPAPGERALMRAWPVESSSGFVALGSAWVALKSLNLMSRFSNWRFPLDRA